MIFDLYFFNTELLGTFLSPPKKKKKTQVYPKFASSRHRIRKCLFIKHVSNPIWSYATIGILVLTSKHIQQELTLMKVTDSELLSRSQRLASCHLRFRNPRPSPLHVALYEALNPAHLIHWEVCQAWSWTAAPDLMVLGKWTYSHAFPKTPHFLRVEMWPALKIWLRTGQLYLPWKKKILTESRSSRTMSNPVAWWDSVAFITSCT